MSAKSLLFEKEFFAELINLSILWEIFLAHIMTWDFGERKGVVVAQSREMVGNSFESFQN